MFEVLMPDHGRSFRTLRLTPLRDLLRGRITGRLDWRTKIRAAALPETAGRIIVQVVTRTWLSREEKVAVADELIAHFTDALATGAEPDDVVRRFGDPRRAAKLIGRAKRRGRSLASRAFHVVKWMSVSLVLFYAALAVRLFVGRATPTVDYIAQLNTAVLRTPADQRAWPIYRQAILAMRNPTPHDRLEHWPKVLYYNQSGKHWPETKVWLRRHAGDLELVRAGSEKPVFGYILGRDGSMKDPEMAGTSAKSSTEPDVPDNALIHLSLSYLLSYARPLAHTLGDDAKLAAEHHDAARAERDVNAMLALADQLHGQFDFSLVSIGIRSLAISVAGELLRDQPAVWEDARWVRLALRLSVTENASDILNFQSDRLFGPDFLQRIYTDDGQGDGRLTFAGVLALGQNWGNILTYDSKLIRIISPALMAASLSRKELLQEYNAVIDRAEAGLHAPLRMSGVIDFDRERWYASTLSAAKYAPLSLIAPHMSRIAVTAERYLGRRDGLVTGIALELYRRKHGSYPETLQQLTPDLLPAVPADRITGDPVRYRIVNDKPLVYSVGTDRQDDGGAVFGKNTSETAAQWAPSTVKGDWLLYPESVSVVSDDEE